MLKKIISGILKYKGVVIFALAILFAVSVVGTVFLVVKKDKINSDVASYLDEKSDTKTGIVFMKENFNIRGYSTFVIRVDEANGGKEVLKNKIDKLSENEKITSITWAGSLESAKEINSRIQKMVKLVKDNKDLLAKTITAYEDMEGDATDFREILSLTEVAGEDDLISTDKMTSFLRRATATDGVYDYVVLFLFSTDGVDQENYALLDTIKNEFTDTEYTSSGTIETGEMLLNDTMSDLPWFILAGVGLVLLILFLTTASWIEPLIMLLTLAVGIVVSMGMNYLFPSVSIISFALSAVLQLAITMDYAVFYTHLFRKHRAKLDVTEATTTAWQEAATSILASGLTTIGGFAALYFMQFRIGADMANVLIKGIILSMITVLTLQPILTLLSDKVAMQTTHHFVDAIGKKLSLKKPIEKGMIARPVARFSVFARIVLVVIAVALFVPCYMAQSRVPFSYLELYEKKNETEEQKLSNELGNQVIIAVPLEIKKQGKSHADFVAALEEAGGTRVSGVLSAFTVLNVDEKYVKLLIDNKDKKVNETDLELGIPLLGLEEEEETQLKSVIKEFYSLTKGLNASALDTYFRKIGNETYTLYTISFNGNAEDEEAQNTYAAIEKTCEEFFGKDRTHAIGMVISSYEMAQITPRDFLRVTLVSVIIIFLIVTVLLKNPLKSFIVVAIIELGIWLNLSLSYLAGESINFIVYVIISSVELGCTVDYAILFANTFERNRDNCKSGKECAVLSATQSMPAIFTGALMISSVCFSMYLISSNIVIRQLVGVLARGAAISFILVALFLTAVWSFFPVARKKVDYAAKMKSIEEKLGETGDTPSEEQQSVREEKKAPLHPAAPPKPKQPKKNKKK